MINKRGIKSLILNDIVYLILFIVFFSLMFYFVTAYQDGAAYWEDFYAKQIAFVIDRGSVGEEIKLDVSKISGVAVGNGVNPREMIKIDNANNLVKVGLRNGKATGFNFFNDVIVKDWRVELNSPDPEVNRFVFSIAEKEVEA
tara:strand:+ start:224 stop:652 length:429 start_codon:yes stop_codon:yes gene_type:complete